VIVRERPRAVVLGRMATMPYAGVVWQTIQYLVGLERLGFDAYYVEAHAVTPRHFVTAPGDDGAAGAAAFLDDVLRRFGLSRRWVFQALDSDGRCYGLGPSLLHELYASASVLLNLHGGTRPRPEHVATNRLVCVATDPVQIEVELHHGFAPTIRFVEAHRAVFSFGENYGRDDCRLPVSERFSILPTRQPVVLDLWSANGSSRDVFTTIANWRQHRELRLGGELYQWSKHFEFLKLIDLPRRTSQALELALSRCSDEHRAELVAHGWRVRDALELSHDLDEYRRYITTSRAEFTVAKDQNVRLRSGWFSDRSATYLAAGRPVVTQDTGFGNSLPTGEGLFAFSTPDEAAAAIDAIRSDYDRHRRAALDVAREHFAHDVVLRPLLERSGVEVPRRLARGTPEGPRRVLLVAHRFPPDATGGVERYTENLAAALRAAGDFVTVIARRPASGALRWDVDELPSGVRVLRLAGGAIQRDRFLADREEKDRLFGAALAEVDPDVVHFNHVLDLSPGFLRIAKQHGAALVLSLHDYYFACHRVILRGPDGEACSGPEGGRACVRRCFPSEGSAGERRWSLRTMYFRRLLGLADRVVFPSAYAADRFERLGAPPERLRVVPNGVWVAPSEPEDASASGPAERGRLVLAFLGAVVQHKGLQVVLDALERARLPAVELTSFGPVGDGAWARTLYARASRIQGLEFRMYGEYEPDDLPLLLRDIDCVVVPSQWPETFCLVAREAHARGIPTLVSRVGALPDGVVEGVNGFVFEHDRPDQLAAALERLMAEPELVPRLRAGARATRLTTMAEHAAAMRATYREALEASARNRGPCNHDLQEIVALEEALAAFGFAEPAAAAHECARPRSIDAPPIAQR
jgi:glycosyltransferase involved in cell wall biosynthesis